MSALNLLDLHASRIADWLDQAQAHLAAEASTIDHFPGLIAAISARVQAQLVVLEMAQDAEKRERFDTYSKTAGKLIKAFQDRFKISFSAVEQVEKNIKATFGEETPAVKYGGKTDHPTPQVGSKPTHRSANRKLTDEEVREIKALLREGASSREIGLAYNVNPSNIDHIRAGRTWSHIK